MMNRNKTPMYMAWFCTYVVSAVISLVAMNDDDDNSLVTSQPATATPIARERWAVIYDRPSEITATTRSHWSDFVVEGEVVEIKGPYFNTVSGTLPAGDIEDDFYDAPGGPFDDVPLGATESASWATEVVGTAEAWTAAGNEVSPWEIYRLAVIDVSAVMKGITDTEKLVVIVPGGIITHTSGSSVDVVYESEQAGLDDLAEGEDVIIFSRMLFEWQIDARSAYPVYDRCLSVAAVLTSEDDKAYCQLLGASYSVAGSNASSLDQQGGTPVAVTAIKTEVAQAVSTKAISSTIAYSDSRRSNWPLVTATP